MAGQLGVLLAGIAVDPGRLVGELPLLGAVERGRVLGEWSGCGAEVPAGSFPELFEAQAARGPDRVALVCGDVRLSFAELDARAGRLARCLAGLGAGPEAVVAVALPRSAGMVVALLAVVKAGGVYLPVDPGLPAARVEVLLGDARPVAVVTAPGAAVLAGDVPGLEVDEAGWAAVAPGGPGSDLGGAGRGGLSVGNAAYVMYTSGTGGRPKGVVVEHRALANLVFSQRNGFVAAAGGGRLRAALTASFSFDASLECLALLADGHELHVIGEDVRLDPEALAGYVAAHRIDVVNLTPSYLQQVLPAGLLAGRGTGRGSCWRAASRWASRCGSSWPPRRVPRATTCTARPSARLTRWPARLRPVAVPRWAARCRTSAPTCWTARWARCRPVCRVSCTWPGRRWPAGT